MISLNMIKIEHNCNEKETMVYYLYQNNDDLIKNSDTYLREHLFVEASKVVAILLTVDVIQILPHEAGIFQLAFVHCLIYDVIL